MGFGYGGGSIDLGIFVSLFLWLRSGFSGWGW